MNKFRLLYFICSLLLAIFVVNQISVAQISDSIPEPIKKSELFVSQEEVVQIPKSGTDREKAARLNLLTHSRDSSGRLFVNDMRGKFYVIVDGTSTVYMNLKQLIPSKMVKSENSFLLRKINLLTSIEKSVAIMYRHI